MWLMSYDYIPWLLRAGELMPQDERRGIRLFTEHPAKFLVRQAINRAKVYEKLREPLPPFGLLVDEITRVHCIYEFPASALSPEELEFFS